jgi:phosphinothricin acetyltransferase
MRTPQSTCTDSEQKVTIMPTVRAAQRADLARLVTIYHHYVEHSTATFDTEPASAQNRRAWFETFSGEGPHRLLVASEGERVVGCALSSPYRTHPAFAQTVEVGIYIDPEVRSMGIGSALYGRLFEELRSEALHLAVAGIALPNDASVALHRKFGFTDVGVFEEYATKNGAYLSSLWMQRRL